MHLRVDIGTSGVNAQTITADRPVVGEDVVARVIEPDPADIDHLASKETALRVAYLRTPSPSKEPRLGPDRRQQRMETLVDRFIRSAGGRYRKDKMMRKTGWCMLLAGSLILLSPTAGASRATTMDLSRNGRLFRDFADRLYRQKSVNSAYDGFVGSDLIQHNPRIAGNGRAAAIANLSPLFSRPVARFPVEHLLIDHDLALAVYHGQIDANGPGARVAELFRIASGQLVEHWDAFQPMSDAAPDPHPCRTCSADTIPAPIEGARSADRQRVMRFFQKLYHDRDAPRAYREYASPTMATHDPASDGRRDLVVEQFLADQREHDTRYTILHAIMAGDLAMAHVMATQPATGQSSIHFEVFRIVRSRIVEQTSIVQIVPAESAGR